MTQLNNLPENYKVEYEVDGQKIKLTQSIVQQYIVGTQANITLPEFKFFAELCQARKLNPFLKEAYLIKYSEKQPAQMVVSKDVVLKRAVLHPQYDGKESGVIIRTSEGNIMERAGCFVDFKNEELLGGWCKVYRKDWKRPEFMSVSLDEVASRKNDGTLNSNWLTKSATMVEKVAKVRALREAFVEEFGGMYIDDEFSNSQPEKESTDPFTQPDVIDVLVQEENIDLNAL
jgi:phage recombination protein Bet